VNIQSKTPPNQSSLSTTQPPKERMKQSIQTSPYIHICVDPGLFCKALMRHEDPLFKYQVYEIRKEKRDRTKPHPKARISRIYRMIRITDVKTQQKTNTKTYFKGGILIEAVRNQQEVK
jgi:hypothetical protein